MCSGEIWAMLRSTPTNWKLRHRSNLLLSISQHHIVCNCDLIFSIVWINVDNIIYMSALFYSSSSLLQHLPILKIQKYCWRNIVHTAGTETHVVQTFQGVCRTPFDCHIGFHDLCFNPKNTALSFCCNTGTTYNAQTSTSQASGHSAAASAAP